MQIHQRLRRCLEPRLLLLNTFFQGWLQVIRFSLYLVLRLVVISAISGSMRPKCTVLNMGTDAPGSFSGMGKADVLVCGNCQRKAHAVAEKYKKEIAGKFNIPLPVHHKPQNKPASSALPVVSSEEVRAAATALQCQGEKLPPDRYEKFMQVLKTYYGQSEITDEDLTKARLVDSNTCEKNDKSLRGMDLTGSK